MANDLNHSTLWTMVSITIVCYSDYHLVSSDSPFSMLLGYIYIMDKFLIVWNHKTKSLALLKGTDNLLHTSLQYLKHHTFLPLTGLLTAKHNSDLITMHSSLGSIFRYKDILVFSFYYYETKALLSSRECACLYHIPRYFVSSLVIEKNFPLAY